MPKQQYLVAEGDSPEGRVLMLLILLMWNAALYGKPLHIKQAMAGGN